MFDIVRFHENCRIIERVTRQRVFVVLENFARAREKKRPARLRVIRQLRKRNTYGISGNIIDSRDDVKVPRLPVASSIRESSLIRTYVRYVRGKRHVHEANCDGSKVQRASSALEKTKSTGIGYQPGNEITMPLEKKIFSYRRPFVHFVREQ